MRYQLIAYAKTENSHYQIFIKKERYQVEIGNQGSKYWSTRVIGPPIHRFSQGRLVFKAKMHGDKSGNAFRYFVNKYNADVLWG